MCCVVVCVCVCLCLCMFGYVHVSVGAYEGQERASGSVTLES